MKEIVSLIIIGICLIGNFHTVHAESNYNVIRVSGNDRYETSLNIANNFFNDDLKNIIIVNGENFPDALTGAILSKKLDAPILLVNKNLQNEITNIDALAGLNSLKTLSVSDNKITDITALKSLTNLNLLYLGSNKITDISALKNVTNLNDLDLDNNQIVDISVFKDLINLATLRLDRNRIKDISSLKQLSSLRQLALYSNELSDSEIEQLKNSLLNFSIFNEN